MQCILSLEHKIRHMLLSPSFSGGWACTVYRDFNILVGEEGRTAYYHGMTRIV